MTAQNRLQKNKLQWVVVAALVIVLFVGGYALSNLAGMALNAPDSAANADTAVGASLVLNSGGEALVNPPRQVQDFTLMAHTGEPVSLSDLRGEPVMLMFGYTHCPDVCPTTLAQFKRAKALLGEEGERVHFVLISVDGERDTPEALANYVPRFDPEFIGMSGTDAVLQQIAVDYGLVYQIDAHEAGAEIYGVAHSSAAYLIDKDGALRSMFFFGADGQTMANAVHRLLAEEA